MEAPRETPQGRRRYRFRREHYERLAEDGLFHDKHVELLYGFILEMSPQGNAHAHAIQKLTTAFAALVASGRAEVRAQLALAASDDSEPEPDLCLVAPGDYLDGPPRAALLVVEAANDSLEDDRVIKGRLYAEIGIPEYWLIDLRRRRLERYLEPKDGTYTRMTTHERGESLAPVHFPDVAVPLDEIVPPPKA